jgi:hypothetical protein
MQAGIRDGMTLAPDARQYADDRTCGQACFVKNFTSSESGRFSREPSLMIGMGEQENFV